MLVFLLTRDIESPGTASQIFWTLNGKNGLVVPDQSAIALEVILFPKRF